MGVFAGQAFLIVCPYGEDIRWKPARVERAKLYDRATEIGRAHV